MGKIVSAMASSHAFTFMNPDRWDSYRQANRDYFRQLYGSEPSPPPGVEYESLDECRIRFARITAGIDQLRNNLARTRPDVLVVIGDDQNEHFKEVAPQLALYLGESVVVKQSDGSTVRQACSSRMARELHGGLVDHDFDVTTCHSFPGERLIAHAFTPIVETISAPLGIPVVLLFVNSIHFPAMSPKRCYLLGKTIRDLVERSDLRVSLYGSGGLSHFTAGYPWRHYKGPHTWGTIVTKFDRESLAAMERGDGESLSALTSQDLLDNGEIELRSWISVLGAVGPGRMRTLAYEPIHRACMGMAAAYWEADQTP